MWGNNKNNKKYGYKQQQLQAQETAHEMELVIDTFHITLEALEEYIGKANYYSDWESKRQIYRKSIADSNDTVEGFEDLFLTQLLIVKASVNKKPEFFRKEVQKEYKKWISAVGINTNNCPEKLKNYLFTISEILEGRGEEFVNQTRELIKDVKLTPQDSLKFFGELQEPLNKNDERGKLLKGRNWNQVDDERKLSGGNIEQGEKALEQISKAVSSNQIGFYDSDYYRRQRRLVGSSGSATALGIHPTNLNEVVHEVKANPQNWTLDEIATEINRLGWAKNQEPVLYCRHARFDDYDQEGKLNFNNNPIYRWENFNVQQRFEIKRALNISVDYLTNEEIKWVVREVKDNPRVWRIEPIQGQTWLIHNSAQGNNSEIGTLIHNKQKFSETEWMEVNGAFERVKFIDDIKQNAKLERGLFVINRKTGERYEGEDLYIHNSLEGEVDDKTGYLIYVPNSMIRVKDLTEAEQKAIGYKSEAGLQTISSTTPKNNDKGIGTTGILTIIGSVSVLVIGGALIAKRQLKSQKNKFIKVPSKD